MAFKCQIHVDDCTWDPGKTTELEVIEYSAGFVVRLLLGDQSLLFAYLGLLHELSGHLQVRTAWIREWNSCSWKNDMTMLVVL